MGAITLAPLAKRQAVHKGATLVRIDGGCSFHIVLRVVPVGVEKVVKLRGARYRVYFFRFAAFCCITLMAAAVVAAPKKLPVHPIDLNTATLKQLEELPGVGPTTAQAILNFREKSGPFKSVNDLLVIPRISKRKLDKMRPYITIGPPAKNH